jgi:uncharacterized membrane protein YagU involved in acid resistance
MNNNYNKIILLAIFIFGFIFGIILILTSSLWDLLMIASMRLAGSIIAVFFGVGMLLAVFRK